MIARTIEKTLKQRMGSGKAITISGPRQVGKTTLIKNLLQSKSYLFLDGDNAAVRNQLNNPTTEMLRSIISQHEIVFIDEAQRIENIGLVMKQITDQFKHVQLIASGSSAFDLNSKINEPLTGRKWEYKLYPISYEELENSIGLIAANAKMEQLLLYGMYPDVLNHPGDEREVLTNLAESYLFRDLLAISGIRKSKELENLLRALAFQVGSEVSLNELSKLIGIDKNTVSSYIQILEMGYVIFPITGFSRNLRKEIRQNQKYYFYDNGIRNSLIQNFNTMKFRNDRGALWENFLMAERMKFNAYHRTYAKGYFWRTVDQQEIDYIEEKDSLIAAYEFKWNSDKIVKTPKAFSKAYDTELTVVHQNNFRTFIMNQFI
jgi:predicted AAA+ superfamily ATPase